MAAGTCNRCSRGDCWAADPQHSAPTRRIAVQSTMAKLNRHPSATKPTKAPNDGGLCLFMRSKSNPRTLAGVGRKACSRAMSVCRGASGSHHPIRTSLDTKFGVTVYIAVAMVVGRTWEGVRLCIREDMDVGTLITQPNRLWRIRRGLQAPHRRAARAQRRGL